MTVSNDDDDGNAFVTHKKPYLNIKSKAATDYPSRPVKFKVTESEEVIETQYMFTEVLFLHVTIQDNIAQREDYIEFLN